MQAIILDDIIALEGEFSDEEKLVRDTTRSFVSVQGALCMYPVFAFGSAEQ